VPDNRRQPPPKGSSRGGTPARGAAGANARRPAPAGGRRPTAKGAASSASKGTKRPAPPRKRHRLRWLIVIVLLLISMGIGVFILLLATTTVPSPNEVVTREATVVYWSDGTSEIGRIGESTRRSVGLETVPLPVQQAILAAEDRDFYDHGGISPVGIVRSLWNNVTGGSTQGASTITQQYAKNAFLTQERSWERKIREVLLATKLETLVSKDEILQNYLNTIYFGRGADGIEAAAIAYFGVPASELTLEQGAVLAAVIKSPSDMVEEDGLTRLRGRWEYVLDGMVEQGWITQRQRDRAEFPEIVEAKAKNRLGGQTGFLLSMVESELVAIGFDETEIQRGGLRITSTFDRKAQRGAQNAVRKAGPTSGTDGLRIGLASVRPGTGEVVAIYAGADFITDQINNATRQFAQAGSTFKPFALTAAVEQGIPLGSIWNGDSPATVDGYTFNNYGDRSYGPVTLLQATEDSINSAYVELESDVGVDTVADAAVRAGVPADTPGMDLDALDLTFVLGTASPSAVNMANAYATFAAQGTSASTYVVTRVVGPNDGLLYEATPDTESAFEPDVANTVTYALNRVVTNGTGGTARALGRPAAAKTGTTDDNKSAWFVGYTPQLSTAVFMTKEDGDGKPISMAGTGGLTTVTGGSFPAAIWTMFMERALEGQPTEDFPEPPEGTKVPDYCPTSIATEDEKVPSGCPTPEVIPEFTNETVDDFGTVTPTPLPTDEFGAPIDPSAVPSGVPVTPEPSLSQSPDVSVFDPSPTPEGGELFPPEPTNEAGVP
jgi:membrane peptidoglycan carboxypeptidase